MNDELLKKCLDFDEDDLLANRLGTLTPRQRAKVATGGKVTRVIALAAGILVLVIALAPLLSAQLFGSGHSPIFWLLWILIWVPIGIYVVSRIRRYMRPQGGEARVRKAEGPIRLAREKRYDTSARREVDRYKLQIGSLAFDIEDDLAALLAEGDVYAVYHLEGRQEILSMERLAR